MLIKTYRFVTRYLGFLINIYLYYRLLKGKEDKLRFSERFGRTKISRPKGALLWFHAASIGESVSILPLINKISGKYSNLKILVTTGTITSSKVMANRLPKNAIHQFVPVDKLSAVKKFLNHWRPDLAFCVESELWPNLVIETARTGCPLILLNGRMSSSSHKNWLKYKGISSQILSKFSACLVQTEDDKTRFTELGANEVIVCGNLKYDAPALPGNPQEVGDLISQIAGRPSWVAASTHNGEEEKILRIHKKLKNRFPDLLTILVPRHPKRGKEIVNLIKDNDLTYAKRADKDKIIPYTDIYLVNTIGEIGTIYRSSGIVFMGGSLVNHGGQNPLEPARLDCAILTGEHFFNFKEIYSEMIFQGAVNLIRTENELAHNLEKIISNINLQKELSHKAYEFVESKRGILDRYIENIEPFLKPLTIYNFPIRS